MRSLEYRKPKGDRERMRSHRTYLCYLRYDSEGLGLPSYGMDLSVAYLYTSETWERGNLKTTCLSHNLFSSEQAQYDIPSSRTALPWLLAQTCQESHQSLLKSNISQLEFNSRILQIEWFHEIHWLRCKIGEPCFYLFYGFIIMLNNGYSWDHSTESLGEHLCNKIWRSPCQVRFFFFFKYLKFCLLYESLFFSIFHFNSCQFHVEYNYH